MRFRSLQMLVRTWCIHVFGEAVADDKRERNFRFLEESLELVQAGGMTRAEVLQLVDYTYSRPVGVVAQEAGQAAITLAALCAAYQDVDLERSVSAEWARIQEPEVMEKIRRKQATKPKGSSLPGSGNMVERDGVEGLPGRWDASVAKTYAYVRDQVKKEYGRD